MKRYRQHRLRTMPLLCTLLLHACIVANRVEAGSELKHFTVCVKALLPPPFKKLAAAQIPYATFQTAFHREKQHISHFPVDLIMQYYY